MFDYLKKGLQKAWHISKNVILTGGALAAEVGIKLFAVKALFQYLEIDAPTLLWATEILAISIAAYVFIFSRGLRSWRLLSSTESRGSMKELLKQVKKESSELSICPRICALSILTLGVIAPTISYGLVSYYGSNVFFRYIGVNNNIVLYCINSYLGITSGVTFVYFGLPVGVENIFSLFKRITGYYKTKMKTGRAVTAGMMGVIRTAAQAATSNFVIKHSLKAIAPNISTNVQEIVSAVITLSAVPICSQNRAMELYKLMKDGKKIKCPCSCNKNFYDNKPGIKQSILFKFHDISGFMYALLIFALNYDGCVDIERTQFRVSSEQWYFICLNIIAALSGTAVEYAFTNIGMYRESGFMFFSKRNDNKPQIEKVSENTSLLPVSVKKDQLAIVTENPSINQSV